MSVSVSAEERIVPQQDITAEDGDTLVIDIDGKQQRIQLSGIDAPEDVVNPKLQVDIKRSKLNQDELLKLGKIATEQLTYLLKTQAPFVLYYNPHKRDRYGRIPGDIVNAKGESIAAQMINNGYAIVSRRAVPAALIERLLPLQQKALQQQRGLWGLYPQNSRRWAAIPPEGKSTR
jgi:endonuclease YncB( thermonuclease family)